MPSECHLCLLYASIHLSVVKAVIIVQESGFERRRLPVIDANFSVEQSKIIIPRKSGANIQTITVPIRIIYRFLQHKTMKKS